MRRLCTAESVAEGHPDKICDQISDAVLDECLRQDPVSRVACETFATVGLIVVGGEITTRGYADIPTIVRNLLKEIGYVHRFGFCHETCAVINAIGTQSPDIAQGVDAGGAGDQGIMIGYATNETPQLMPLPIMLAHKIMRRLAQVRRENILNYLGPDGKTQVTVEYEDDTPMYVHSVVLAAQHTEDVVDNTGKYMKKQAKDDLINVVIKWAIDEELLSSDTKFYVNETGKFVIGGPQSDTGMTGRKICVDTYGSAVPHGGGCFSGKDPTKVDRSAAYMARYLAKNIVAAGLANKCKVEISYAIGVVQPVAVFVDTFGTAQGVRDEEITRAILRCFSLTPRAIIQKLDLLRPIYLKTACYGHFGREEPEFTWEQTDAADLIRESVRR